MLEKKEGMQMKFGFHLDVVTTDFVKKIVKIYGESVGALESTDRFIEQVEVGGIEDIKEELKENGYCNRRLGSSLNWDSKLVIRITRDGLYCAKFIPNLDINRSDESEKIIANTMVEKFEIKINEFLIGSGLGSEIRT